MEAKLIRPAEPVAPVDVEETVPLLFDYTDMVGSDTFSGAPTVTCELLSGTDTDAASRRSGAPEVTGLQVVQMVTTLQLGARYLVRCKQPMASGQVLVQAMVVECIKVGAE